MNAIVFPAIRLPHLERVALPPVMRVRLDHPQGNPIVDIEQHVDTALGGARRLAALPNGARVAVAVGSRGIAAIPRVVAAAVGTLKRRGLSPFVVPAMGSHGGGTAVGQKAMLAKLGVSEDTVGAPVHATMETVDYGATAEGIRCRFDKNAAGADAVIVINRVKSHTSFDRPVESGLVKMVAVGLGKAEGARNVHLLGVHGYTEVLPQLARISLEHSPIAFGLAVVENADKALVALEGVEPEDFFATDERLLHQAKALLARLPFAQLDVLVVEQIGKDVSGAGMDFAVTGRSDIRGIPNPERPFIHKLAVLGLTEKSAGNGLGLGVADFTTKAVVEGLDLYAMYLNSITSTFVNKINIPMVLADDREAIRACAATCWRTDPENARLAIIRSTLHLNEMLVSPGLYRDIEGRDGVTLLEGPTPMDFSAEGELMTRC